MNTRGSAAQGPMTATRRSAGRPSPSSSSAVPASSRTTDRSAIVLAGAVGGRVEVDGGGTGHRALRRPVRVEQPELRLLGEEPPGGPVHEGLGQIAPPDPLRQAGAEADGVRQLHVDAGGERLGAGLVGVRGDAVHGREERHRPVVGHDRARESPLLPQQIGEQPVIRGRGDAVHVRVGVHPSRRLPGPGPSRTAAG